MYDLSSVIDSATNDIALLFDACLKQWGSQPLVDYWCKAWNLIRCNVSFLQSHVTQLISRSTWTLIMIHWTVSPMSIHLRSMKGEQARHTVSYVQYQCSPFHVKEDSEILTDGKWTN